ncbi:MAG: hypothetical protein HY741_24320 [Chloroflexi bacterium]|nr:hypothetical protein [Chloroflexota bacterium]
MLEKLVSEYRKLGGNVFYDAQDRFDSLEQKSWGIHLAGDCFLTSILFSQNLVGVRNARERFEQDNQGRFIRGTASNLIWLGEFEAAAKIVEQTIAVVPSWSSEAASIYLDIATNVIRSASGIPTNEIEYIKRAHELDPRINPWMNSIQHVDLASQAPTLEDAEWHLDRAFHLYEDFKPGESALDTPHFLISGLPEKGGVLLPLPEDPKTDIRFLKIEDCLRTPSSLWKDKFKPIPKTTGYLELFRRAIEEEQIDKALGDLRESLRIAVLVDYPSRSVWLAKARDEGLKMLPVVEQMRGKHEASKFRSQLKKLAELAPGYGIKV